MRISAAELPGQRTTKTDAEGRYEFKELPAGRYTVSASKDTYVTQVYGRRRPFDSGVPLQLAGNQSLEGIDLALARGGVIAGRILDEVGDPEAEIEVQAMRYAFAQGRRQLVSTGTSARTNDLGEFRLAGLAPGEYFVAATLQGFGGGVMESSDVGSTFLPTYYPGTANAADAQRLAVAAGQTLTNISMSLAVVPTARVSGIVIDRNGRPPAWGYVGLTPRTDTLAQRLSDVMIKPDGSFAVSGVAPGDYTIEAHISAGFNDNEAGTAAVFVAGADLTGVRIVTGRPAVVTGRVVLKGASDRKPSSDSLRVLARPADPLETSGRFEGVADVKGDLKFELHVRRCVCVIRLLGPPAGWYLNAVRLGGTDVTDSGIEFHQEQEIGGVEVELTNHPTDLSGRATDSYGEAARDYTVVVFARDRARWRPGSRWVGASRPDQNGRYTVRGLPAGDYYAVALEDVEPGQWTDSDFLERIVDKATAVSLGEGETRSLDLKLVSER